MPPPRAAEFPLIVELFTVVPALPVAELAPPNPFATLPTKVLLRIAAAPPVSLARGRAVAGGLIAGERACRDVQGSGLRVEDCAAGAVRKIAGKGWSSKSLWIRRRRSSIDRRPPRQCSRKATRRRARACRNWRHRRRCWRCCWSRLRSKVLCCPRSEHRRRFVLRRL